MSDSLLLLALKLRLLEFSKNVLNILLKILNNKNINANYIPGVTQIYSYQICKFIYNDICKFDICNFLYMLTI